MELQIGRPPSSKCSGPDSKETVLVYLRFRSLLFHHQIATGTENVKFRAEKVVLLIGFWTSRTSYFSVSPRSTPTKLMIHRINLDEVIMAISFDVLSLQLGFILVLD